MVTYENKSGYTVYVALDKPYSLAPGATVDVPEGYGLPRKGPALGSKLPPTITMLAPQLKPSGQKDRERVASEFAEDYQQPTNANDSRLEAAFKAAGLNPAIIKSISPDDARAMLERFKSDAIQQAIKVVGDSAKPEDKEPEYAMSDVIATDDLAEDVRRLAREMEAAKPDKPSKKGK